MNFKVKVIVTCINKCRVLKIIRKPERYWVGNVFCVHGLLRHDNELDKFISPFIMLDYASPMEFEKTKKNRGVGEHPNRGFEKVTLHIKVKYNTKTHLEVEV